MKTTMTPSSRGLNVNCEMVEAFEAVLPQSILAKLEPFSFAICCKDGGYVICLQSFKALSDDVYHGPLTKYIDKNNWFGFVDDVKSKPEYKARLAELHVPAAILQRLNFWSCMSNGTTTTSMSSISSFVLMQCIIFHCMIQQFRQ